MSKHWYEPHVSIVALAVVSAMDRDELDDLQAAIHARRQALLVARLTTAGFSATAKVGGHLMPFVLVTAPDGLASVWATADECQRLLDTVHNLPPAAAFARWASRVEPLEVEPYTRADAIRDTRAARQALRADFAAGKITTDEYVDLQHGTSFMDLAPRPEEQ